MSDGGTVLPEWLSAPGHGGRFALQGLWRRGPPSANLKPCKSAAVRVRGGAQVLTLKPLLLFPRL